MENRAAFSLIELMVVIAIVAILTAVAIPSYKTYRNRAAIASVVPVIEANITKAIQYVTLNGRFPTARDLGLPADPNDASNVNKYDVSSLPQLQYFAFGEAGFSANCGRFGWVYGQLNTANLGLPAANNFFYFQCDIARLTNTYATLCLYSYGSGGPGVGTSVTGNIFPGWYNLNCTTAWDGGCADAQIAPLMNNSVCST